MKTKTRTLIRLQPALHLLAASALLLGLWAAGLARAEDKPELIEMPINKKLKLEVPATAAGAVTPAAKPAATGAAHGEHGAAPAAAAAAKPVAHAAPAAPSAPEGPAPSETVQQLRNAISSIGAPSKNAAEGSKRVTLTNTGSSKAPSNHNSTPSESRQAIRARALALANGQKPGAEHGAAAGEHGGEVHWSYDGENGPQNWGKLKPEFNLCAIGKRQSPIAIRDDFTLLGPAESIRFMYTPSRGSVVNNGHTIQVDLQGENSIIVRGSEYKLLQFHFHTPSEEMVNSKRYAMVAHLVHKNDAGQLAVVAVLMEPGEPNPMIETVWTYLPLDTSDRVSVPEGLIDMNKLLPPDQRYYQFIGSLTTPPCTEGVLWMVLKQPLRISQAQFRVFTQLFPHNARPVQPVNARPVREAQ
jgi:carbonic anhydrase